jgi:hypothetical protein
MAVNEGLTKLERIRREFSNWSQWKFLAWLLNLIGSRLILLQIWLTESYNRSWGFQTSTISWTELLRFRFPRVALAPVCSPRHPAHPSEPRFLGRWLNGGAHHPLNP